MIWIINSKIDPHTLTYYPAYTGHLGKESSTSSHRPILRLDKQRRILYAGQKLLEIFSKHKENDYEIYDRGYPVDIY